MSLTSSAMRGQRLPRSARRAQLLEAAQSVFVEAGYHQAAMDDIAERAGVSKPVLYQHFPGKLDLYLALLDQSCERLELLVREALAGSEDNNERVHAAVAAYFSFVAEDGGAFRLVFESDLTGEPQVRNRIDNLGLACAESIADVIAADTGVDDDVAMLLAMSVTGQAQVAARHWLSSDAELTQDQATEIVSTLTWRGLGSFPKIDGNA